MFDHNAAYILCAYGGAIVALGGLITAILRRSNVVKQNLAIMEKTIKNTPPNV